MTSPRSLPLRHRIALLAETVLMTWLVPKRRVGAFYGLMFKIPLLLHRLRLGGLIPRNVLILTTTGRRTGRRRRTPMEFSPGPTEDVVLVMAGWEGHTDWYRNARADPRVRVWMRGKEWDAVAEPVPEAEVARLLRRVTEMSPSAARMWSRWSDAPIDGSEAGYLAAAAHFPSLYLKPVDVGATRLPISPGRE